MGVPLHPLKGLGQIAGKDSEHHQEKAIFLFVQILFTGVAASFFFLLVEA